jgi:hypothetical protein
MPECDQFCHPVQRYAATQCKVMLPTFGDHQRVCKVSSTPEALGAAVAVRQDDIRLEFRRVWWRLPTTQPEPAI